MLRETGHNHTWTTPPPLPRLPSLSIARNACGRPIILPSQSTTTCHQDSKILTRKGQPHGIMQVW